VRAVRPCSSGCAAPRPRCRSGSSCRLRQQRNEANGKGAANDNGSKRTLGTEGRSNTKSQPGGKDSNGKASSQTHKLIDLRRHFVLEVDDPEELAEYLQTPKGLIGYKEIGTEAGWRRFKAVKAEPAKSPKLEFVSVAGPKF
jgi:hypothetical protein